MTEGTVLPGPAGSTVPAAAGTSGRLAAATVWTLALNVSTVVLNFGLVVLLTRVLGARAYGAYASALAWSGLLTAIGMLGLTPLIVRQLAAYETHAAWGLLRGLLRRVTQAVVLASAVALIAAAAVGTLVYAGRPELLHPFWIALALGPLLSLTSIRQAAMQGLGRVVAGRLPETVVAPLLVLVLSGGAALVLGDAFGAGVAVALQVAATIVAFLLGGILLRRALPASARLAAREYDLASWRRSGLPLALLTALMAANTQSGTILLGALSGAADAGMFNVASRMTMFISFVALAASYPLMPAVARLHATGELEAVQRLVLKTARTVLFFAVPTGIVLVAFAPRLLRLFDADFGAGGTAMRILAIGEVVNVLTGYGGLVLVMSGHESDLTRSVAAGAVLNIALSAVLIPTLGVSGAAAGAAAGMVCANLLMTRLAWQRLGIWAAVAWKPKRA